MRCSTWHAYLRNYQPEAILSTRGRPMKTIIGPATWLISVSCLLAYVTRHPNKFSSNPSYINRQLPRIGIVLLSGYWRHKKLSELLVQTVMRDLFIFLIVYIFLITYFAENFVSKIKKKYISIDLSLEYLSDKSIFVRKFSPHITYM